MAHLLFLLLLALCAVSYVRSEVTILNTVVTLYDRSPKLHIKGAGFDAAEEDILINIGRGPGQGDLIQGDDFTVTKDEKGLGVTILLNPGKRWGDLEIRPPPVALILNGVSFKNDEYTNLLPLGDPILLANILQSPTVTACSATALTYKSVTQELRIEGSGYLGAKFVNIYFQPPLVRDVDYDVVTKFPMTEGSYLSLKLHHGGSWFGKDNKNPAAEGPLKVMGLDTGGGPVSVGVGKEGIVVANVHNNLDSHKITVTNTASQQLLYRDQDTVTISGSGFNATGGNKLSFANGLMGQGHNYTITAQASTQLTLTLTQGQVWRKNSVSLPAYLTVLAVASSKDSEWVSVGPINAGKGQNVAMVFDRPTVVASSAEIYRTHSHELIITGTGFPKTLSRPLLRFSPALKEGIDYTVSVSSTSALKISLLNGQAWAEKPGVLKLLSINTRGDEGGWVALGDGGKGVQVAKVMTDVSSDQTGGVEVFPMGDKVYQSTMHETIKVVGSGFKAGLEFSFKNKIKKGTDYNLDVTSANTVTLTLLAGKQWSTEAGALLVTAVKTGGKSYPLGGGAGIRVADVLKNPDVSTAEDKYHNTQSKLLYIRGEGFTNMKDTKVLLRPTQPNAYKIKSVSANLIRLQLLPGKSWGGDSYDVKIDRTPVQVSSIDSGAGSLIFPVPVTVGYDIPDKEGVYCDDSCDFSFDDVCDDHAGSETSANSYYGYGGDWYDDLGGYGFGYTDDWEGGWYDDQFDSYYAVDDEYRVSACLPGTDCTDCGGIDYVNVPNGSGSSGGGSGGGDYVPVTCSNDCVYARDGVCDDPRGINFCASGSDCQDCGPVGASNFTVIDDDAGWWDDDDDYWSFNDEEFMDQTRGIEHQRQKQMNTIVEEEPPARVYVEAIMLGVAYTVGLVIVSSLALFGMLKFCGYEPGRALQSVLGFGAGESDIEMATSSRMSIHASTENPMRS